MKRWRRGRRAHAHRITFLFLKTFLSLCLTGQKNHRTSYMLLFLCVDYWTRHIRHQKYIHDKNTVFNLNSEYKPGHVVELLLGSNLLVWLITDKHIFPSLVCSDDFGHVCGGSTSPPCCLWGPVRAALPDTSCSSAPNHVLTDAFTVWLLVFI